MIELPSECPHRRFTDLYKPKSTCREGYVYLAVVGDLHKIGYTGNQKVNYRMNSIRYEKGTIVTPLFIFKTNCGRGLESDLQACFIPKRSTRRINQTDYFKLTDEDVRLIKALTFYNGSALEICPLPTRHESLKTAKDRQIRKTGDTPSIVFLGNCGHRVTVRYSGVYLQTASIVMYAIAQRNGGKCNKCGQTVYPQRLLETVI